MKMLPEKPTFRLKISTYSAKKTIEIINANCYDLFYKYALVKNAELFDYDSNSTFTYIATDLETGDFIGYANGYFPIPNNILWIQTFLINKDYSRKGYGTEFFSGVINLLAQINTIDSIYLGCFEKSVSGNLFWKSLDFIKIDEKEKTLQTETEPSKINIYKKTMPI
jgi:hypothetical protein